MIVPDGIRAAALREKEFHPTAADGKTISAWDRRAETIEKDILRGDDLEKRLAKIEGALLHRPF